MKCRFALLLDTFKKTCRKSPSSLGIFFSYKFMSVEKWEATDWTGTLPTIFEVCSLTRSGDFLQTFKQISGVYQVDVVGSRWLFSSLVDVWRNFKYVSGSLTVHDYLISGRPCWLAMPKENFTGFPVPSPEKNFQRSRK